MDFLKTCVCLKGILSLWMLTTAGNDILPRVEDLKWVSINFKTILTWVPSTGNYTYTVMFSEVDDDWNEAQYCIRITETECDLTNYLSLKDRTYSAYVQTEPDGKDYDLEDLTLTYASDFNPYRESKISAVSFKVGTVRDSSTVALNISDPLTPLYQQQKLLTIKDILKNDLKYMISYQKAGSTGKKDVIHNSSLAEFPQLDPEQSFCFSVVAFIPSRPKPSQLGAWSQQQCSTGHTKTFLQQLSSEALVGGLFVLVLVIVIVSVTVLCCRRYRRTRAKTPQAPARA
ncbi:tissue factor-like [Lampris incognitus]|uniref:tissue factor-like n=1 Tax=Lampris incognitus TaxID=2546036 RepID=UPI0024B4CFA9|nr:tissue factor-like [Lampris incognitus]